MLPEPAPIRELDGRATRCSSLDPFNVLVNYWWRQSPPHMDSPAARGMLAPLDEDNARALRVQLLKRLNR